MQEKIMTKGKDPGPVKSSPIFSLLDEIDNTIDDSKNMAAQLITQLKPVIDQTENEGEDPGCDRTSECCDVMERLRCIQERVYELTSYLRKTSNRLQL
jgi:hypothetical protein